MTQMEVSEFQFTHTNNPANYICLSKSDTLANCKGKYQYRNGKPLAYVFSARFSNVDNSLETIPTGWFQKGALIKTAAAWKKMYKKAGLTRRDLNTYGREPRFTFDTTHKTNYAESSFELIADGLPTSYDSSQYDENGDQIQVFTTRSGAMTPNMQHAFDQTTLTVPSHDGSTATAIEWQPHVIGNESNSVLTQYVISRGTVDLEDEDLELSETLAPQNYLTQMLSDNEETSDDVIEDHRDHGDYRPYELSAMLRYTTKAIVSGANVVGQDTMVVAPLGLLKWNGSDSDKLSLKLEAVIEM